MNALSLFSGIGGLDLALAEWVTPIAYCEADRYAQAVLLSRMQAGELPTAPICTDIRKFKREHFECDVDILYGGFPCQDLSVAGIGKGLAGERSGLYFEIERLIRETKPAFVFLENVPAIRTRGLGRVVWGLSELGYDCRWTTVSAAEIGAPHLRKRWFLLAHTMRERLPQPRAEPTKASETRTAKRSAAIGGVQTPMWDQFTSGFCGVDDGLPLKTHRLRALGNAVVPAQAREAFMRLMGL
jgi:DNA (cytosine-5)-methyltransferase 1